MSEKNEVKIIGESDCFNLSQMTKEEIAFLQPKKGEIVLFWGSGSPQAWRVLITLEEKKLTYRSVCLSFSSGILKLPFFLSLNRRQRVPILVDGHTGAIVHESLAICEYLDRIYNANLPMFPSPPVEFALAQTRNHEANDILAVAGELIAYLRKVPVERQNATVLQRKWSLFEKELQLWETYLTESKGCFLVSEERPLMCDVTLFTSLAYVVRCGMALDGVYPHLAVFYLRMCARESVEKTWPPHWRTSIGCTVLSPSSQNLSKNSSQHSQQQQHLKEECFLVSNQ